MAELEDVDKDMSRITGVSYTPLAGLIECDPRKIAPIYSLSPEQLPSFKHSMDVLVKTSPAWYNLILLLPRVQWSLEHAPNEAVQLTSLYTTQEVQAFEGTPFDHIVVIPGSLEDVLEARHELESRLDDDYQIQLFEESLTEQKVNESIADVRKMEKEFKNLVNKVAVEESKVKNLAKGVTVEVAQSEERIAAMHVEIANSKKLAREAAREADEMGRALMETAENLVRPPTKSSGSSVRRPSRQIRKPNTVATPADAAEDSNAPLLDPDVVPSSSQLERTTIDDFDPHRIEAITNFIAGLFGKKPGQNTLAAVIIALDEKLERSKIKKAFTSELVRENLGEFASELSSSFATTSVAFVRRKLQSARVQDDLLKEKSDDETAIAKKKMEMEKSKMLLRKEKVAISES
jgi:hypothetical protein